MRGPRGSQSQSLLRTHRGLVGAWHVTPAQCGLPEPSADRQQRPCVCARPQAGSSRGSCQPAGTEAAVPDPYDGLKEWPVLWWGFASGCSWRAGSAHRGPGHPNSLHLQCSLGRDSPKRHSAGFFQPDLLRTALLREVVMIGVRGLGVSPAPSS